MTKTYILPNVGVTGVIQLADPFSGLCAANTPYTVSAVRSLQDIVASGQDPYALYYEPFSLSTDVFASDVSNNVCILSLTSTDGDVVYVPNSYLVTLPVAMGVPYATMMVAVNLGALPQTLSLKYLMSKIQELANDLIGVQNADVRAMRVSSLTYLSVADSNVIETARQNVMNSVTTDYAQLLAAQSQLTALQQKYNDLEAWVIANAPAPSP